SFTFHSAHCHDSRFVIFFFQAEDGIRDFHVTGVQTCALPIYRPPGPTQQPNRPRQPTAARLEQPLGSNHPKALTIVLRAIEGRRSEERRVGKECRSRWSA